MKSWQKIRIIPRWEPDWRFAVPLHYHAPVARRVAEFIPDYLFRREEEAWRTSAPLE